MRVAPQDYEAIRTACFDTLKAHGLRPFMVQSTRHAWDCFNKARDEKRLALGDLYQRYNDSHLQTALNRIFKEARNEK